MLMVQALYELCSKAGFPTPGFTYIGAESAKVAHVAFGNKTDSPAFESWPRFNAVKQQLRDGFTTGPCSSRKAAKAAAAHLMLRCIVPEWRPAAAA